MDTESNYELGLTPMVRAKSDLGLISDIVNRALSGDPGDSDDINRIMETVSASMNETPSSHIFNSDENEDILIVLVKPKEKMALILNLEELKLKAMKKAVNSFGFNEETLEPV